MKISIAVSRGRRGWTVSGVVSAKREKSMVCQPEEDAMSSNVMGGTVDDGVWAAGCWETENTQEASGEMRWEDLALAMAYASSVRPM